MKKDTLIPFLLEKNVALLGDRQEAFRYAFNVPESLKPTGLILSPDGELSVTFKGTGHSSIRTVTHVFTVTTPTLSVKLETDESLELIAVLQTFRLSEIIKDEHGMIWILPLL
jgi:hypothetical protein